MTSSESTEGNEWRKDKGHTLGCECRDPQCVARRAVLLAHAELISE